MILIDALGVNIKRGMPWLFAYGRDSSRRANKTHRGIHRPLLKTGKRRGLPGGVGNL